MSSIVAFLTQLVSVVNLGAVLVHEAEKLYVWFRDQFINSHANPIKAAKLLEVAKSVYFAVEAIAEITGAKGPDKWAIAEKAIPKAAKSAGLELDASDIGFVKQFIEGLAQLNKVAWK